MDPLEFALDSAPNNTADRCEPVGIVCPLVDAAHEVTYDAFVIELPDDRYRGGIKGTKWIEGKVATFLRHCSEIRTDKLAAELDASRLINQLAASTT